MDYKKTLQEEIEELKKWGSLTDTDIDKMKEDAVKFFCGKLLEQIKSSDRMSKQDGLKEIYNHSDLFSLQYNRKSFLEKLTLSKKNPNIQLLKDPLITFNELCNRKNYFQLSFIYKIKEQIEKLKRKNKEKRAKRRQVEPIQGDVFDKDNDYLPDRLALVHATKYRPQKDKDGCYCIETHANATHLTGLPRNTIHFAISHHVQSHSAGDWNDMPYVVIAPMKETIEKNGKPLGISSVDTFFEFGLDEKMVLPKGTQLFEPANGLKNILLGDKYYVTYENRTIYKEGHKIDAIKKFLKEKGYYHGGDEHFFSADSETAEKIANMGKKMGIVSTSCPALHSGRLSGINSLGKIIYEDILYPLNSCEAILNAKKITKKDFGYITVDGEDILYSVCFDLLKKCNKKKDLRNYFFDNVIDCIKKSYEWSVNHSKDKKTVEQNRNILQRIEEVEKKNLPFREKFFEQYAIFTKKRFSKKEIDVFMAWLDKSQQRIDAINKRLNNKTLERVIEEKSESKNSSTQVNATKNEGR